ncbi:hypothetical protein [Cellulomonas endophytica]|uniref:hypothetical protein n=1 Tax=Cellulomonas endophytica TaxID=2494735 RepID=UPI00101108F6|nr:hypothetical protein [Cellulomonas endophytica]
MVSTPASSSAPGRAAAVRSTSRPYGALVGITSLGILLQGLWAGVLMAQEDPAARDTWASVHQRGAEITLLLALVALVVVLARLRERRDLVVGTTVLVVLLALEYVVGLLWGDAEVRGMAVVHVPLAMLLMAVAVWLPLRHRPRA